VTDEPTDEKYEDITLSFADDDAAEEASDDVQITLDLSDDVEEASEDDGIDLNFGEEAPAEVDEDDENDDVADAAVAELRAELTSKFGDWYVLHTYSGMENRVKQNLENRVKALNMEDFIFEAVVPTEETVEIRNGAKKTVTRTSHPGYVLVRMELTDDSWSAVRHTPSVTGFVGYGNTPVALDLEEVVKMLSPSVIAKASAGAGQTARRKKVEVADFSVGNSVMVVDGPFAGVHATIMEIHPHNEKVTVMVDFMGRETPIELDFSKVQKSS
jgi:transcription termination/antitermination protein NusG